MVNFELLSISQAWVGVVVVVSAQLSEDRWVGVVVVDGNLLSTSWFWCGKSCSLWGQGDWTEKKVVSSQLYLRRRTPLARTKSKVKFLGINASSIHVFHLAGPTRAVVTLTSFVLLEISCQVTSFRCERYMVGLGWMDKVCSMYVNTLNNSIWSMRKFDDRWIYCISNWLCSYGLKLLHSILHSWGCLSTEKLSQFVQVVKHENNLKTSKLTSKSP